MPGIKTLRRWRMILNLQKLASWRLLVASPTESIRIGPDELNVLSSPLLNCISLYILHPSPFLSLHSIPFTLNIPSDILPLTQSPLLPPLQDAFFLSHLPYHPPSERPSGSHSW